MHVFFFLGSLTATFLTSIYGVVDMAWLTYSEQKKGTKHDRARHAAEIAEEKEHRLSKPRTKDTARHAVCEATEVASYSHTLFNLVWPCKPTDEVT